MAIKRTYRVVTAYGTFTRKTERVYTHCIVEVVS